MVRNFDIVRKFYEGGGRMESIPWAAWQPVFLAWMPFVWALFLVMISTMVIMRKQWVEHERLIYPLMQVPLAMTEQGAYFGANLPVVSVENYH